MNSYQKKYLKYKQKYLNISKQIGGEDIILQNNNKLELGGNIPLKINNTDLSKEKIDYLGFSELYPNIFFITSKIDSNYYHLKAYKIDSEFIIPNMLINITFQMTEEMKLKYKIVNEEVTDEKYKKYFRNYDIKEISHNTGVLMSSNHYTLSDGTRLELNKQYSLTNEQIKNEQIEYSGLSRKYPNFFFKYEKTQSGYLLTVSKN
jgi:hypothetical protein